MDDDEEPQDQALLALARSGDRDAVVRLWTAYYPGALAAARAMSRQPRDAEEIASDAFSKMLAALMSGSGPTFSVRAYLHTAVRNVAVSRGRLASSGREVLTGESTSFDQPSAGSAANQPAHAAELGLVREAFASLPRRWQIVLWRSAVDMDTNISIGAEMDISPNAVAALAKRARAGFRAAYMRLHLSHGSIAQGCAPYVPDLVDVATSGSSLVPPRLESHLGTCEPCTVRLGELQKVDVNLGALLTPAVIGLAPSGLLAPLAGHAAGTSLSTSGSHAATTSLGHHPVLGWLLAGSVAAALATGVLVWPADEALAPIAAPTSAPAPTRPSTLDVTTAAPTSSTPRRTTTEAPSKTSTPHTAPPIVPTSPPRPRIAAPLTTAPPVRVTPPPALMTPMTVELQLGSPPAGTLLTVAASAKGVSGAVALTVSLPTGVRFVSSSGAWRSCTQGPQTIQCSTAAVRAERWTGDLLLQWPPGPAGPVTATVRAAFANGSPAVGSATTSWPP